MIGPEDATGPQRYAIRLGEVLRALGVDAMVLPASPLVHSSWDTEYRYRADSNLLYLTGVEAPEAVLAILGHGDGPRTVLFLPEREPSEELWTGPGPEPEEIRERLGLDAVHPRHEMADLLPRLLRGARHVHFRLDADPETEHLVREALRWGRTRGSRTGVGPRGVVDPGGILHPMRRIKDDGEIRLIRTAAEISRDAFREVEAVVGPGVGEWEVEAVLEAGFRRRGADGPAFPTIVGSGANACVLHYTANRNRIGEDDLVVVDGGAALRGYASDMTRTFPAGGRATGARREVLDLVGEALRAACAVVGPGRSIREVHDAAVATLTRGLAELGLLRGSVPDLVAAEHYKAFFPHQTSHWLGLDVHDPGDYAEDGAPVVLRPGMVLTVEPGLYFPPAGSVARTDTSGPEGDEGDPWAAVDRVRAEQFAGIGVRIEDDLLVTADGGEVLTRS